MINVFSLVVAVILGIFVGWLSAVIAGVGGFGLLGDLMIGIIGAIIGSLIFSFLGIVIFGFVGSLISAVMGAVIFLIVIRVVKRV